MRLAGLEQNVDTQQVGFKAELFHSLGDLEFHLDARRGLLCTRADILLQCSCSISHPNYCNFLLKPYVNSAGVIIMIQRGEEAAVVAGA